MTNLDTIVDDSGPDTQADMSRFTTDTVRSAMIAKIAVLIVTAIVISPWVGWAWTAAWVVACVVFSGVVLPLAMRWVVGHGGTLTGESYDRHLAKSEHAMVVLALLSTGLQMSGWVAAWIVGRDDFAFMAALCLAGALIHANAYAAGGTRGIHLAALGPPIVVCVIAPLFLGGVAAPGWLMSLGVGQVALVAWLSQRHSAGLTRSATRLEREWRAAMDANKAKSAFLATMSHELRTPLNAVIGYAEMLEESLDGDGRAADAADARRIRRAGRSLLGLINEILDLSKIEAGKMEVVASAANLRDMVADVVQTAAHIAEKHGNELAIDLNLDHDVVVTDGVKLRQCLLNLVSNACKFTENGKVTIVGRATAQDVYFEVVDTGCGISEAAAGKLFQPFVQVDGSMTRKQGGTGLGLVITQRLAQLLGGDVTMKSVLGEGSTFILTVKAGEPEHFRAHMTAAPMELKLAAA